MRRLVTDDNDVIRQAAMRRAAKLRLPHVTADFSTDNGFVHQKTTILVRLIFVTIGSCERQANALSGGIVITMQEIDDGCTKKDHSSRVDEG
jgi:hypothetical protein